MSVLAALPALRALSLAMNRLGPHPLQGLAQGPPAPSPPPFQHLATLDLSYNGLSAPHTLAPSSPLAHLPA